MTLKNDWLSVWLQRPAREPVCQDTPARGYHTCFLCRATLPYMGPSCLLKTFPQGDTSARQRGFKIRVSPLLGELSKAIEPYLPICQLYRRKLGLNKWSLPTTKSLDPIVATAIQVDFQGKTSVPLQVD